MLILTKLVDIHKLMLDYSIYGGLIFS